MKLNIQTKIFLGYLLIIVVAFTIIGLAVNRTVEGNYERHIIEAFALPGSGGIDEYQEVKLVVSDPETVSGAFLKDVRKSLTSTMFLVTVLAILLSYFLSRMILSPLKRFTEATEKIAGGDYSNRVKISTGDEIEELGVSMNKMAESLEKIETLRRELVSNVSHELATPLTNISGYLEALHDGVIRGEEPTRKTLELLQEEADRLKTMVIDLRVLSSIESSRFCLDLAPVNLSDIINGAIEKLKPQSEEKGVGLTFEVNGSIPEVSADRNRLTQILINLIDNAIRFTPEGGDAKVSVEASGDQVSIEVSDNGIGISSGDLPHIFERFYRGEKSRSRETGGTGIGLAVVKELVKAHCGEINVESTEGKGSRFIFSIPISQCCS